VGEYIFQQAGTLLVSPYRFGSVETRFSISAIHVLMQKKPHKA